MQANAKISTGELYDPEWRSNSGARYHLVETYSVNGGWERIYLANPKSHILTKSLWHKTFSGFKSLWKKPLLWRKASAWVIL